MSDATPIDEALDGLSELAACDLRLAKRFCARIEALPEAEDADERANDLARSYQRMARSYRQTIVVQMRLRRELAAEAKADADDDRKAHARRVGGRKSAIKARLGSIIWDENEREAEEAEPLYELFLDLLDVAAERADFLDTPIDVHLQVLSEAIGLASAPADAATSPARAEAEPPTPAPPLFNGRLAPPMDLPPWADEDSS